MLHFENRSKVSYISLRYLIDARFLPGFDLGVMETTNVNEVGVSGTTEEFPESTVEINVKTLDSQTYTLRVNKYVSFGFFQISNDSINIVVILDFSEILFPQSLNICFLLLLIW